MAASIRNRLDGHEQCQCSHGEARRHHPDRELAAPTRLPTGSEPIDRPGGETSGDQKGDNDRWSEPDRVVETDDGHNGPTNSSGSEQPVLL